MSLGKKKILSQGASGVTPTDNFAPITYTGNGTTQSISTLDFQPDLVWIKKRGPSTGNHLLQNTIQGAGTGSALSSNSTGLAGNFDQYGYISAFDTNGFTLQGGTSGSYPHDNANENNSTYVSWCFNAGTDAAATNNDGTIASTVKANQDAGFSVVKYDGAGLSGSATTVGHGLDAAPELIIVKAYETGLNAGAWFVYSSITGNAKELYLNTSGAEVSDSNRWNSTSPSSTVFTLGSSFSSYPSYYGGDTIAYCFHSVDGYQSVGGYSGSNSDLQVNTGFQPRFLMLKNIDASGRPWVMIDSLRTGYVEANSSSAEADTISNYVTFNSQGFLLVGGTGSYMNESGWDFLYLAIA